MQHFSKQAGAAAVSLKSSTLKSECLQLNGFVQHIVQSLCCFETFWLVKNKD